MIKTYEQFISKVKEKHNGTIEVISGYENSHSRVKLRHICGYEWEALAYGVISGRGRGCPKCAGSMKKTHEDYLNEVYSIYRNEIEVLGNYAGRKKKILHRHTICGFERMVTPGDILAGKKCPKCVGKNRTTEEYKALVFSKAGEDITVLEEYQGATTKIMHQHVCGYEWLVRPADILSGYGCPKCGGGMKKTHEQYLNEIKEMYGKEIVVLEKYIGANIKILHRHSCGNEWRTKPSDLLHGYSCPYCKQSKGEKFIRGILKKESVDFVEQYTPGDCRYKRPLHFDFAVMESDDPVLIIEYDGMQHYKPTGFKNAKDRLKIVKARDKVKDDYCQKKNIELLRIPYWMSRDEIQQVIRNHLGGVNIAN